MQDVTPRPENLFREFRSAIISCLLVISFHTFVFIIQFASRIAFAIFPHPASASSPHHPSIHSSMATAPPPYFLTSQSSLAQTAERQTSRRRHSPTRNATRVNAARQGKTSDKGRTQHGRHNLRRPRTPSARFPPTAHQESQTAPRRLRARTSSLCRLSVRPPVWSAVPLE